MSADWQVGDLALCVRGGFPEYVADRAENGADFALRTGALHVVRWVGLSRHLSITGLKLEGIDWGWFSNRFVKVTPPAADEFDTEVIELLNRKPVEA